MVHKKSRSKYNKQFIYLFLIILSVILIISLLLLYKNSLQANTIIISQQPSSCSGDWISCPNAFVKDNSPATAILTTSSSLSQQWSNFNISLLPSSKVNKVFVKLDFYSNKKSGYLDIQVSGDGGITFGQSHIIGGNTAEKTFLVDIYSDLNWTTEKLSNKNLVIKTSCIQKGKPANPSCYIEYLTAEVSFSPFNFSFLISPESNAIIQGQVILTTANINLLGGISQPVTLSYDNCPPTAICVFAPSSRSPPYSSEFSIKTYSSTPVGNYPITLSATGDGITKSSTFNLIVIALPQNNTLNDTLPPTQAPGKNESDNETNNITQNQSQNATLSNVTSQTQITTNNITGQNNTNSYTQFNSSLNLSFIPLTPQNGDILTSNTVTVSVVGTSQIKNISLWIVSSNLPNPTYREEVFSNSNNATLTLSSLSPGHYTAFARGRSDDNSWIIITRDFVYANNYTINGCTDSDGVPFGINAYKSGSASKGTLTLKDTCAVNGTGYDGMVYEAYCDSVGNVQQIYANCFGGICDPNTGACKEGLLKEEIFGYKSGVDTKIGPLYINLNAGSTARYKNTYLQINYIFYTIIYPIKVTHIDCPPYSTCTIVPTDITLIGTKTTLFDYTITTTNLTPSGLYKLNINTSSTDGFDKKWTNFAYVYLNISNPLVNSSSNNQTPLQNQTSSTTNLPNSTSSCTDTDGGINYDVKGTTTGISPSIGQTYTSSDICGTGTTYQTNQLIEHYCNDIYHTNTVVTCQYGCSDGECLSSSQNLTQNIPQNTSTTNTSTTSSFCSDSDNGLNFYKSGTVTKGSSNQVDYCSTFSPDKLVEYYCDVNGSSSYTVYICPSGRCQSGYCTDSPSLSNYGCVDNDGGIEYSVTGQTINFTTIINDACGSGQSRGEADYLYESYCDTQNNIRIGAHHCSAGCWKGQCLDDFVCTDSDGGIDYYTTGIVSKGSFSSTDYCGAQYTTGQYIIEQYCNISAKSVFDISAQKPYFCTGGCINGACISPSTTGSVIKNILDKLRRVG